MGIKTRKIGFILTIVVLLTITELLLRIFWNPPYLNPKYQRDDLNWLKNNVHLNHYGYRDQEYNLTKEPGVFRIFSLGSSYTFGWYINDPNNTYPKQLEKQLSTKFPNDKVEVINAARPGFNLQERINRFKIQGLLFEPDVVTLSINISDVTDKSFPPRLINNKYIRNLRLYQFIFGKFKIKEAQQKRHQEIGKNFSPNSEQLKKLEDKLQDIKKVADDNHIELIIFILPEFDPENPNAPYLYEKLHEQIKNIAQKHDIKVIDFLDKFKAYSNKNELILNPTDPHPSVLADQLAAQSIVEKIDFGRLIAQKRNTLPNNKVQIQKDSILPDMGYIFSVEPNNWVYFNREFNGTMDFFPPNSKDQEIFYMEDILKTAAAFSNDGWPGAKIEHRVLAREDGFRIPKTLYGYEVMGISGITGFWVENGALNSKDLGWSSIKVWKKPDYIEVTVNNNPNKYLMYKVTADIKVKQVDIDAEKVITFFSTENLTSTLKKGEKNIIIKVDKKISSLPQMFSDGKKTGYTWLNNQLVEASFLVNNNELSIGLSKSTTQDAILEIPIALETTDLANPPSLIYKSN